MLYIKIIYIIHILFSFSIYVAHILFHGLLTSMINIFRHQLVNNYTNPNFFLDMQSHSNSTKIFDTHTTCMMVCYRYNCIFNLNR